MTVRSSMSEADWQAIVVQLARLHGFERVYHTHDSRRSEPGFPDLVLVKPPRVLFVELKRENGKLTDEQHAWMRALAGCPGVEVYVWRPPNLDGVQQVLAGTHEGQAAA
jgi:hypothetical protein